MAIKDLLVFATLELKSHNFALANQTLLNSSDPFAEIIQSAQSNALNVIYTDDKTLIKALPLLSDLPNSTIVNVRLSDFQSVVALKDLPFSSVISTTDDSLVKNASFAQLLANNDQKVLHFYTESLSIDKIPLEKKDLGDISVESEDFLKEALAITKHSQFEFTKGSKSASTAIVHLGEYTPLLAKVSNLPIITLNALNPLPLESILKTIPPSVTQLVILEQSSFKLTSKFSNLLLEFFQSPNLLVDHQIEKITSTTISNNFNGDFKQVLKIIESNINESNPLQNLFLGEEQTKSFHSASKLEEIAKVQKLEESYTTILDQLFGKNLTIYNQFNSESISQSTPEFGFGSYLYNQERQKLLIDEVHQSLSANEFNTPRSSELIELLSNWLIQVRGSSSSSETINKLATSIIEILKTDTSVVGKSLFELKGSLFANSSWLIGSDSWSYDLGSSGVHHVLQSNKDINVLILDNEPYDSKVSKLAGALRKKDIGLYAMNYGNAFVGSVAIYSSYTQVLTTLIEASKFNGPSIVLAYLPIKDENDSPLDILTSTKNAVGSGYIPLYRYNPTLKEEDQFKLDSTVVKENLKKFLERENKLTLLSAKNPQFARSLASSQTSIIKQKQDKRSKEAYSQLLEGLSGPPLSIYFASDGGSAESTAKKLAKRAKQRGLKSSVFSMDDIILEDLPTEENIVFVTSTSGQGEFPQNGKNFWDSIKTSGDLDLEFSKISVFGLGDSLYWPRAQDKHYYNKPAKDLFERLLFLNAKELIPLGLGDDQEADGYQTGYNVWEAELWKALGVDDVKTADEPPPITNEDIKLGSNFLRGTIVEGLQDESTGAIDSSDQQLTKFHGIYMQDERDLRDSRKAAGLEPYYIFMARVRLPGGITTPDQWLTLDKLSDERGNGTIKLTTRATFQLHGIVKHNLKPSIRAMNASLMDTLAACGDVNRNVMISALPGNAKIHSQVSKIGALISEHLLPQTTAYHEIWLKGPDPEDDSDNWNEIFENRKEGPKKTKTLVAGNALVDIEPLYGPTYLPRKFKVNITVPPYNDVDVWAGDVGLITIVENNEVVGFNVLVGGGMGSTHNNKKTYPRTGSQFGFVEANKVHIVCEKIMLVQKEHGNRKDRKNARLKYTVDTLGVEVYKEKVEELWGEKFLPARDFEIKDNTDNFGWVTDELGQHHFTCFIENGRVENTPELPQKQGLKKIAEFFKSNNSKGTFRLTGNQHVVISSVSKEELSTVKQILKDFKLDNTDFSGLRLSSAACVAFPTCGLAMAESERYLPVLIGKLETALEEYGLRHDAIVMRMTGCPNGCARPWLAEIALVGKAYGTYNLMLGGGYHGQRLNKIFKQSIKEEEVLSILKPLFKRWALERLEGEHFGDFVVRVGVIKPTLEGKYFHDDIPEDA